MKKKRLDAYLCEKQYFETKTKAQNVILAGDVQLNGETIYKPAYDIDESKEYTINIKTLKYVSRGGFKLEKALLTFDINLENKTCLDAGASSGGFTDCMLQNNAKFVYAVDVGYGQLAWKLRQNTNQVKVIERTNIKNCDYSQIYDEKDLLPSFCAMDLSFISILKVLDNINKLTSNNCEIVALIKPQFEAGKENVGKNGVVKDKKVHFNIISNIINQTQKLNLKTLNLTFSPIKGPKGNIEYLIHFKKDEQNQSLIGENDIQKIIDEAFSSL